MIDRLTSAAVLCIALSFGPGTQNARSSALLPVPSPDLSRLDPVVQRQLSHARSEFEAESHKQGASPRELADAYGQLGKLYHSYTLLNAAEACYQNAISLMPREFSWRYYLAQAYHTEGNLSEAISSYESALSLRPNELLIEVRLGDAQFLRNEPDLAESLYEKALSTDPSCAAALAGRGNIALYRQDYKAAVKWFESALTADPNAKGLYYPLALAFRGLGAIEKAQASLARRSAGVPALRDPLMDNLRELATGKQTFWMRGWRAFQSGDFVKAAEEYGKMVAADLDDPIAWMELGSALVKMGKIKDALQDYRRAVDLSPGTAAAHQNLAMCLTQLGMAEEAVQHYREAMQLDPGLTHAYFHLANELIRLKRYREAESMYSRTVELEPQNGFARFMQGIALVRLRRFADARSKFEEARHALLEDLDISAALARLLAAAPDRAVRDGRRAVELIMQVLRASKAPDLDYVRTFAMALAETGRFDQAIRVQRELVDQVLRAKRSEIIPLLNQNLEAYIAGRACRTPWLDDDPIFSPVPGSPVPLKAFRGPVMAAQ